MKFRICRRGGLSYGLISMIIILSIAFMFPLNAYAYNTGGIDLNVIGNENSDADGTIGGNDNNKSKAINKECVPYSIDDSVCNDSIPFDKTLTDKLSFPPKYKRLKLGLNNYCDGKKNDYNNYIMCGLTFNPDDWNKNGHNVMDGYFPKHNGQSLTLQNVASFNDANGIEHKVDVKMTILEFKGNPSINLHLKNAIGWRADAVFPNREGMEIQLELYYAGTNNLIPNDTHGVTGFTDLDGRKTNNSDYPHKGEVIELLSGFNHVYAVPNTKIKRFADNGFGTYYENRNNSDITSDDYTGSMITTTFIGNTLRFRYVGSDNGHSSSLDYPLLPEDIKYNVNVTAYDKYTGKPVKFNDGKTEWIPASNAYSGDDYNVNPPAITGYDYTGLHAGSDALNGIINGRNVNIRLEYVSQVALPGYPNYLQSFPMTGSNGIILVIIGISMAGIIIIIVNRRYRNNK